MNQGSSYDQLRRNIIIRADIYGGINSKPRILAAGYGFEGIMGIPGLLSENQIGLAKAAGAGVAKELLGLDPTAPLRNITSGSSLAGVQVAGFSDSAVSQAFMDAMPIEFSHPVLPSTVLPENFRIYLNTGEVVTPLYVSQNPNLDFNERQTVVAFGYFGNRLPSSDPRAIHPVRFEVVNGGTPLQLITPNGLVKGTGLSQTSNNPYDPFNGPTLVGAKLSRLSLAGDYPAPAFPNSVANHGVEYYGTSKKLYRLRLFTSGGFSPDGVSGFEPDDFSRFFQLTARGGKNNVITIGEADTRVKVKGGTLKVKGIADLGNGLPTDPAYTYAEDHDNQFDIIIKANSRKAIRALESVVLPDPRLGTHSPIYNPGGPGTAPLPKYRYTQPSPGQTLAVEFALKDPATVSWADQSLDSYDSADNLAVAFRLRDSITGEWRFTSSSSEALNLVSSGNWELVDVPFATNANDSYATNVVALRNSTLNDTIYTTKPRQIRRLERAGYNNKGIVFTAYDKPFYGLDPIWQLVSPAGQHQLVRSPEERSTWLEAGWRSKGVAIYSVSFPNSTTAAV
jgi:hypothetical protein